MEYLPKQDKERIIKELESMPFAEARNKILTCQFPDSTDSPNHKFRRSWLESKDAELREELEFSTLRWARHAAYAAYAAAIIAAISIIITITINLSTDKPPTKSTNEKRITSH